MDRSTWPLIAAMIFGVIVTTSVIFQVRRTMQDARELLAEIAGK